MGTPRAVPAMIRANERGFRRHLIPVPDERRMQRKFLLLHPTVRNSSAAQLPRV
ncbi:MAG: hypothetical protein L3J95_04855 [Thermoplasmata archaeon]|nr:hypothetical protein [Thermoplasmata archaeon]MCI4359734.1 hypothetical protein [Thermoplasmata archaeon]